jgi:hypothetical protein
MVLATHYLASSILSIAFENLIPKFKLRSWVASLLLSLMMCGLALDLTFVGLGVTLISCCMVSGKGPLVKL